MIKFFVCALVVLGLGVGVAEAASPTLRHFTSAIANNPERLPALPEAPSVHFESGARDEARRVAALLPASLSQVARLQGRPFAHPVTVGVYASPEAFAPGQGW